MSMNGSHTTVYIIDIVIFSNLFDMNTFITSSSVLKIPISISEVRPDPVDVVLDPGVDAGLAVSALHAAKGHHANLEVGAVK